MPFRQVDFQYQDDVAAALESTISADRLSKYLKQAGFNKDKAIRLYVWNSYISQSLHFPLESCEVSVRNAVNECLVDTFGLEWYQASGFFAASAETQEGIRGSIAKVVERIKSAGHPVTNGRIVAGLSFEFWVGLLSSKYDRPLWQTRLHAIFPNLPKTTRRKHFRQLLWEIKELRNRVAHYEPIFERDLSKDHSNIILAIRHRCRHTAEWVNHHSRFHLALRAKP